MKLSRRTLLAAALSGSSARAMGRTPYGGRLRLTIPWPIAELDPALLHDGFSALFAAAAFEPLYAQDALGAPYPALAQALPERLGRSVRVALRPSLTTASGKPLSGADIVATLARARERGAAGVLGELEPPSLHPSAPLSVTFARTTPEAVARALSSPLCALVPRGFSPLSPDGCGAFQVELSPGRALLRRNMNAGRGPSFLDAIEVTSSDDLAELLRGFEAGRTDVGWFGSGLYRSVKDAVELTSVRYGFAVLMAGKSAGAWGAPGTLQALLDAIPPGHLTHLGLRGLPTQAVGSARWGGPATTIAVLQSAPQLVAVARALAASLATPGHPLVVAEKTAAEFVALKASGQYGLRVDCVRAPSSAESELELALRTAVSPKAAQRAPKTLAPSARELGKSLPLGIIGELRLWGARREAFNGLAEWSLGSVWERTPR